MTTTTLKTILMEMISKNPKFKEGYIRANWKDIVGNLENKTSINYLKNDKLFIKVDNSTILHFMKMNSNIYIKKINKLFDEMEFCENSVNQIKEIAFMVDNKKQ